MLRHKITEDKFFELWKKIELSRSGEPGIYFTNDKDWGTNPCVEISLRPNQFCNLVEINASDLATQEELELRVRMAARIATLQAGYTDFHYLRPVWKRTTEKDALIGVSMTGIASGNAAKLDLKAANKIIKEENAKIAELIGIRPAARRTCIKPAGTSSLVLGCSSGIHAWHSDHYIRRIRVLKDDALYQHLSVWHPELVEDDLLLANTACIKVPQKAPQGATLRHESALELLERVKHFSKNWIKPGHSSGNNSHNISATVSIKDDEWGEIGEWMWENRAHYNGLSVLPYDNSSYTQMPFEDCSAEVYEKMSKSLHEIDLTRVIETDDDTDLSGEIACGGGACEIK
jgi:ribonucleoside-diphosphate reductase alpha chain